MENEVATKKEFKTALAKVQETFTKMVVQNGAEMHLQYDEYQKLCVMNMLAKMQELAISNGLEITNMDLNNITGILQTCAMLNLNVTAVPRECYVITRNTKVGNEWKKVFEFGIEGDGNDKLLRKFGVDVDKVISPWIVREKDGFTYPSFNGLEITPPTWQPKDYTSDIVRIVYPIIKTDKSVEFHISERESVVHNLQAHISNNIMKNKNLNDTDRDTLNDMASKKTLDEILSCPELLPHISPAWKNAGSRDAMIMRKMKNNATKKYPKDFKNAFVSSAFESTYEDYDQYHDERINKEEAVEAEVQESAMSQHVEPIEPPIKSHIDTKEDTDVKTTPMQETKPKAADCPY